MNPKRVGKSVSQRSREDIDRQNELSALVILRDVAKWGGAESALVTWAYKWWNAHRAGKAAV